MCIAIYLNVRRVCVTTMFTLSYFLFTDASAILYDEQTKKPCRKFLQKGNRTDLSYIYPLTGIQNNLCVLVCCRNL